MIARKRKEALVSGAEGTEKVVLITGTSSGIGLAAAVGAARAGWRVIATMRDTSRSAAVESAARAERCEDLIDVRRLDVTDRGSARECVESVLAEHGRLDAVVNNAGAGHIGTLEFDGVDPVRGVLEVNFFGVLEVMHAAMPHLRASRGRAITVTSVGGVVGQPFNEAYCAAKSAVEGYLESLAPVAAIAGVTVVVVEPGAVSSEFVNNVAADRSAELGPYTPALRSYLRRTADTFSSSAQSAADAAGVIVDVLDRVDPPFRIQTSEMARSFVGVKLRDHDGAAVQALTSSWLRAEVS